MFSDFSLKQPKRGNLC